MVMITNQIIENSIKVRSRLDIVILMSLHTIVASTKQFPPEKQPRRRVPPVIFDVVYCCCFCRLFLMAEALSALDFKALQFLSIT